MNTSVMYETIFLIGGRMNGIKIQAIRNNKNIYMFHHPTLPVMMIYRRRGNSRLFDYGALWMN